MSIIKKGAISENITIAAISYICNKCGNILTVEENKEENNRCNKCSDGIMILSHIAKDIEDIK